MFSFALQCRRSLKGSSRSKEEIQNYLACGEKGTSQNLKLLTVTETWKANEAHTVTSRTSDECSDKSNSGLAPLQLDARSAFHTSRARAAYTTRNMGFNSSRG
ncbi:hypothetical protein YC2023_011232 [Brassica napus]